MNSGKFVFAQICAFLPERAFAHIVEKYGGNKGVRHFSCWNQLLCMMFGQLSGRESLRNVITCVSSHRNKYYHLGFGRNVSRSNLARANEQRDYRIFEELAYNLIARAQKIVTPELVVDLPPDVGVYAIDSTIVDLCLNVFLWARFRSTKAGIKVHTMYDVCTSIPTFVHITDARTSDVEVLDTIQMEPGSYYVLDRGYVDFMRLWRIHEQLAFFVTRLKTNIKYSVLQSTGVQNAKGILCDQRIALRGKETAAAYPKALRRIKYKDKETGKVLVFMTNNFDLSAEDVAELYRKRWRVELFFKWIKQHLRIMSFWGTSENAVKTQVYIAICTYVLIAIMKQSLQVERSIYDVLQICSVSLLDKSPLKQLLFSEVPELENDETQFLIDFG